MLQDYFSISVSEDGMLLTLPKLLPSLQVPCKRSLIGDFLLRLGVDVDWTNEISCLRGIMKEIARWHTPTIFLTNDDEPALSVQNAMDWVMNSYTMSQVLFPALRCMSPSSAIANDWVTVGDLHALYKVFERC
jgi:DNA mismatch repair protein MLH1